MKQFLLPEDYRGEETWRFSGKDYHYLCRVRRLKTGSSFTGRDLKGRIFTVTLKENDGKTINAVITRAENKQKNSSESKTEIILYQCLPKGKKMDLIVRQAVECGIAGIVPVLSERTVIDFHDAKGWDNKRDRWNKIMKEAAQQSGTDIIPQLFNPIRIYDIERPVGENNLGIFFHEKCLSDLTLFDIINRDFEKIYYIIGPEGGFSSDETDFLQNNNFFPAYLGRNILRTETAALYAAAILITLSGGD